MKSRCNGIPMLTDTKRIAHTVENALCSAMNVCTQTESITVAFAITIARQILASITEKQTVGIDRLLSEDESLIDRLA